MNLRLDLLSVVVASSYLTLVAFSQDHARELMAPYAVVMFVLTLISLLCARR